MMTEVPDRLSATLT